AITGLVTSRVSVAVVLGLAAGLGGALFATRLVESLLWGVTPTDPLALGVGVALLLTTVALAVALPVRRALSVDPVGSLRAE
ncbi:hypothetical protein ACFL3S_11210, partial [Gemmatimonadota bacterium]